MHDILLYYYSMEKDENELTGTTAFKVTIYAVN